MPDGAGLNTTRNLTQHSTVSRTPCSSPERGLQSTVPLNFISEKNLSILLTDHFNLVLNLMKLTAKTRQFKWKYR